MSSHNHTRSRRRSKRRGRGFNPLYVLIPVLVALLAGGIRLMVTRPKPSGTAKAPDLPTWVLSGGPQARRAYTQAVAYRDDLQYIPCYCGCGSMGHTSIVDCHISDVAEDGTITYDRHAVT